MKLQQYLKEVYTDSFRTNGLKATYGELQEFLEALKHKDWEGAKYELSQVVLYVLILTSYSLEPLGIYLDMNLPNWLPWEEDYIRILIWKAILKLSKAPNQELDLEWFNKGNNWKRPDKVVYVLSQAGLHISIEEAEELIDLIKGKEGEIYAG